MVRMSTHLWIRHEARETERRAPVVPADVRRLRDAGFTVTVEGSPQRVFPIGEYGAAGARIAAKGSWDEHAPDDAVVVGIKELPEEPSSLRHTHVYFAHSFKGQDEAVAVLRRFERGGGRLLDIEYLVDDAGRRVVAFGFWAGYVGAALGVLHLADRLTTPLVPMEKADLDERLETAGKEGADQLLALVTGARGRSGRGAQRALAQAGLPITRWDRSETRDLHKQALLGHDLLVNCVVTHVPTTPFVETADLEHERRMRVIADVTSATNMLPVNTAITTWDEPTRRLDDGHPDLHAGPLDVIAIDNLPSLLPKEASEGFSADHTDQLLHLDPASPAGPWAAALSSYDEAMSQL